MHRFVTALLCGVAFFFSASTWARTACPQHFVSGQAPSISNPKLQPRSREVCFEAFAVLHSGLSRTPLYSAEHLTQQNLAEAKTLSRSELSDYARSGFDRGHMSPNADFGSRSAQAESFSLANMVPQVHANNAGVWAGIEGATRQLASSEGELYVISGPAFIGSEIKQVGNVLVPTHLWKVLYSPQQRRAGAYLITNDDTREYSILTVAELEKMIGIQLLPGLTPKIREAGMDLPSPAAQHGKKSRGGGPSGEEFSLRSFSKNILEALQRTLLK